MTPLRRTLVMALMALSTCAAIPSMTAAKAIIQLRATFFAAQIGSTTKGGSVFAGAVVGPTLHHGAVVVTVTGKASSLHYTFQEFFAQGSVKGKGVGKATPISGTKSATVTGSLTVTGGTGIYAGASGHLAFRGTLHKNTRVKAKETGSFSY